MIMKFKKTAVISTAAAAGIVLCTASVFALSAELKTPAVNTASDSDSQTVYDEYGNAFSIAENELLTVVYDEYGNVVSTDKTKYETETAVVYDEKTTDIEYSSDKKGSYYTPDGTEISLPPNAAPGVIKSVPEEERLSGISAAEELKSNFAEADDFTYPLDEKYNELYEYYGGFSVSVPKGENIYAMSDGTVISADFSFPFGKSLVIQHDNGDVWLYAHCDELCVNTDDKIKAGDIIAYVGSTGAAPDNRLYIYNYYNSSVSNRLNNQDIEN